MEEEYADDFNDEDNLLEENKYLRAQLESQNEYIAQLEVSIFRPCDIVIVIKFM